MTALLSKAGPNLTVKLLLDTLQEVLDFEASIAKKFATPVRIAYTHLADIYRLVEFSYRTS